MFIFIQIGADIAYKMTNKTVVDREVLQVVVVSAMSWNSCEEEDLVRVFNIQSAENTWLLSCTCDTST